MRQACIQTQSTSWTSPEVVSAARQTLQVQADLVGQFLAEVDLAPCPDDCVDAERLPMGFLLELGAANQLVQWRLEGSVELGGLELPTIEEAATAVTAAASQLGEFEKSELRASPLVVTVLQTWIEQFAWNAPATLGANVVIGQFDEDLLVEAIANLLWTSRTRLSHHIMQGET